jgi:hypothetical protein
MNALVKTRENNIAISDADGWGDAAAEGSDRVLKGDLLKFADGHWTVGREGIPVDKGRKLVAVGCAAAWVKWTENLLATSSGSRANRFPIVTSSATPTKPRGNRAPTINPATPGKIQDSCTSSIRTTPARSPSRPARGAAGAR